MTLALQAPSPAVTIMFWYIGVKGRGNVYKDQPGLASQLWCGELQQRYLL